MCTVRAVPADISVISYCKHLHIVHRKVWQAACPVRAVSADVPVGVDVRHRSHRHRAIVPAELALLLGLSPDRHLRRRQDRGHSDPRHARHQGEGHLGVSSRQCFEWFIIIIIDHHRNLRRRRSSPLHCRMQSYNHPPPLNICLHVLVISIVVVLWWQMMRNVWYLGENCWWIFKNCSGFKVHWFINLQHLGDVVHPLSVIVRLSCGAVNIDFYVDLRWCLSVCGLVAFLSLVMASGTFVLTGALCLGLLCWQVMYVWVFCVDRCCMSGSFVLTGALCRGLLCWQALYVGVFCVDRRCMPESFVLTGAVCRSLLCWQVLSVWVFVLTGAVCFGHLSSQVLYVWVYCVDRCFMSWLTGVVCLSLCRVKCFMCGSFVLTGAYVCIFCVDRCCMFCSVESTGALFLSLLCWQVLYVWIFCVDVCFMSGSFVLANVVCLSLLSCWQMLYVWVFVLTGTWVTVCFMYGSFDRCFMSASFVWTGALCLGAVSFD